MGPALAHSAGAVSGSCNDFEHPDTAAIVNDHANDLCEFFVALMLHRGRARSR